MSRNPQINAFVSPETYELFAQDAVELGMNKSELIRNLLDARYLGEPSLDRKVIASLRELLTELTHEVPISTWKGVLDEMSADYTPTEWALRLGISTKRVYSYCYRHHLPLRENF